jgi:hypothetical protein
VNADAGLLDATPLTVPGMSGFGVAPCVAGGGNSFSIAWYDGVGPAVARVGTDGTMVDAAPIQLPDFVSDFSMTCAAAGSDSWAGYRATPLDGGGETMDIVHITEDGGFFVEATVPSAAGPIVWDGARWLTLELSAVDGGTSIVAFDPDAGAAPQWSFEVPGLYPAFAFGAQNLLALYSRYEPAPTMADRLNFQVVVPDAVSDAGSPLLADGGMRDGGEAGDGGTLDAGGAGDGGSTPTATAYRVGCGCSGAAPAAGFELALAMLALRHALETRVKRRAPPEADSSRVRPPRPAP